MIEIKSVLANEDTCALCKKPKQVAVVTISGQGETKLCQKHLWAMAEMQSQMNGNKE